MNNNNVFINATVLGKHGTCEPDQALVINEGKITWVGSSSDLPPSHLSTATQIIDCNSNLLTPGLIDCHTHSVYGGNRADEFRLRQQGVSYSEIAQQGGGIQSTVKQTRALSLEQLIEQSYPRLQAMKQQGVTTVEIKSGYGLDLVNEEKMLLAANHIGDELGMNVQKTFLGAHALPPEYQGRSDEYIDVVCNQMIPHLANKALIDTVDVFCESIAFSVEQTERVFKTAQTFGLPIKCHAEQLSATGAAKLAAHYHALSCEHLEYLDEESVAQMAANQVVAVLLPGAFYFLRESRKPPVDLFRQYGVAMAIATDCNPGSSPTGSLPLMMNMACTLFNLSVEEAWQAVTTNAAKALGLHSLLGEIKLGLQADLILWDCKSPADLCYYFGKTWSKRQFIQGVEQ